MKKILLFHQGALGDLVTLFPVLERLRSGYAAVDLVCQSAVGRLARHLGLIDAFQPAESARLAPLFAGGPQPGLEVMFADYRVVVLFSNSAMLGRSIATLTTAAVYRIAPRPLPDRRLHITDHYLGELSARQLLPCDAEFQADAVETRVPADRRGADVDPRRIALHPGSGSRLKNWPLAHWLRLTEHLRDNGLQPEFVLGPAEDGLAQALAPEAGAVIRPTDLIALAARLYSAGGFIGNDSGVTHLAAYLGVPTLAVFGPSDPVRWRPRGRCAAVVTAAEPCGPCFETAHDRCPHASCLESITPAAVLNDFLHLHRQLE